MQHQLHCGKPGDINLCSGVHLGVLLCGGLIWPHFPSCTLKCMYLQVVAHAKHRWALNDAAGRPCHCMHDMHHPVELARSENTRLAGSQQAAGCPTTACAPTVAVMQQVRRVLVDTLPHCNNKQPPFDIGNKGETSIAFRFVFTSEVHPGG